MFNIELLKAVYQPAIPDWYWSYHYDMFDPYSLQRGNCII